MHDAFEPVPILEKLPLQIDCLAAWGESEDRGRGGGSAGAARTLHQPGAADGRLALRAPAGRRPEGNWGEGVQSVEDSEDSQDDRWDPSILGRFRLHLLWVHSWTLSFP